MASSTATQQQTAIANLEESARYAMPIDPLTGETTMVGFLEDVEVGPFSEWVAEQSDDDDSEEIEGWDPEEEEIGG